MKKLTFLLLSLLLCLLLLNGCTGSDTSEEPKQSQEASDINDLSATIYLYAALGMEGAFEDSLISLFNEAYPNVSVVGSYGSSGTLQLKIEEAAGNGIDIFFSASASNVDALEKAGLVTDGSRVDLLGNALCLVTYNDSCTSVSDWENMGDADSITLCDGTVPVGKHTRALLISLGVLEGDASASTYTTDQLSQALGGVLINECANASIALSEVAKHSSEIGTCYYSDCYSYKDELTIIAMDKAGAYTGELTCPVCLIENGKAEGAEKEASRAFLDFLQSDEALAVFEEYCFIVK